MSIVDNTNGLQEVLEMARSLPDAGGGGSSADLVIKINQMGHETLASENVEIIKGDIVSICERAIADSGECIKVEIHNYKYGGESFIDFSILEGKAHLYAEWLIIYFISPYNGYLYSHGISFNIATGNVDFVSTHRYTGTAR